MTMIDWLIILFISDRVIQRLKIIIWVIKCSTNSTTWFIGQSYNAHYMEKDHIDTQQYSIILRLDDVIEFSM